jgi:hypothetical protein
MTVTDDVMRLRKLTEDVIRDNEREAQNGLEASYQKLLPEIEKSAAQGNYGFSTSVLVDDYRLERYLEAMGFVIEELDGFHIISWKEVFHPTLARTNLMSDLDIPVRVPEKLHQGWRG